MIRLGCGASEEGPAPPLEEDIPTTLCRKQNKMAMMSEDAEA